MIIAVFAGRDLLRTGKYLCKIGSAAETGLLSNLPDGVGCFNQKKFGFGKTELVAILYNGGAGHGFKKVSEIIEADLHMFGKVCHRKFLGEILLNVALDFFDDGSTRGFLLGSRADGADNFSEQFGVFAVRLLEAANQWIQLFGVHMAGIGTVDRIALEYLTNDISFFVL